MKIGTKVRFTKLIFDEACGDHPALLWARDGDTGEIVGYGVFYRYKCKVDGHDAIFGVNADEAEEDK